MRGSVEREECLKAAVVELERLGYRVVVLGRHRPSAVAIKRGSRENVVYGVWLVPKLWQQGRWQNKVTKQSCYERGGQFDDNLFFYYKILRE